MPTLSKYFYHTSQIFSRVGIQDGAKWQFCSMTHVPSLIPFSIMDIAMGPWPCPRDKESNFAPPNPWSSANFSRADMGSAPGDRTNNRGEVGLLSLKDLGKSKGGGSMNFLPSFSVTNSCTAGVICPMKKKKLEKYLDISIQYQSIS